MYLQPHHSSVSILALRTGRVLFLHACSCMCAALACELSCRRRRSRATPGRLPPNTAAHFPGIVGPTQATELTVAAALQFLLMGTMNDRGILTSRATWRATEALTAKYESRISPTDYGSPMYMVDVEYTGTDWNGQLKTGMNGFYGANYMQTLFPGLSAGGEIFYLSEQGRSGMGVAARLNDEKAVGTLQVRSASPQPPWLPLAHACKRTHAACLRPGQTRADTCSWRRRASCR